jgi:hypothetical protein
MLMAERELELSVGETLQIGDYLVTIIDIDGDEVSFRVDNLEPDDLVVSLRETSRK